MANYPNAGNHMCWIENGLDQRMSGKVVILVEFQLSDSKVARLAKSRQFSYAVAFGEEDQRQDFSTKATAKWIWPFCENIKITTDTLVPALIAALSSLLITMLSSLRFRCTLIPPCCCALIALLSLCSCHCALIAALVAVFSLLLYCCAAMLSSHLFHRTLITTLNDRWHTISQWQYKIYLYWRFEMRLT